MTERPRPRDPHTLPRGKEVKAVWDPQEPRTPLEHAWNRLPTIVRDYLEIGYMLGNPELPKEERKALSQRRFEAFCIIEENSLLPSLIGFIQLRDAEERKKKK